jgi:Spy/CpxP family protein refolding chaperone
MTRKHGSKTAKWFLAAFLGVVWAAVSGTASWADSGGHGRSTHPDPSRFVWHLLKAKESLGLTDEQTARLQTLGIASKKDAVKRAAEVELAEIDVHQLLHGQDKQAAGDEIDNAVKKLYALKAERRLASIKAFGELRAVLTPEQQKKMRELRGTRRACADGKSSEHSGMSDRRAEADSPAGDDSRPGDQPIADARM